MLALVIDKIVENWLGSPQGMPLLIVFALLLIVISYLQTTLRTEEIYSEIPPEYQHGAWAVLDLALAAFGFVFLIVAPYYRSNNLTIVINKLLLVLRLPGYTNNNINLLVALIGVGLADWIWQVLTFFRIRRQTMPATPEIRSSILIWVITDTAFIVFLLGCLLFRIYEDRLFAFPVWVLLAILVYLGFDYAYDAVVARFFYFVRRGPTSTKEN